MDGYLGQVMVFAGFFIPKKWSSCAGQLLQISQNQAFYAVMGTTYGGDGRTNFGLPDLRGRTPVGEGQGSGLSDIRLGQRGGIESFNLTTSQLPAHTHTGIFSTGSGYGTVSPSAFAGRGSLTNDPTGRFPAKTATGTDIYADTFDTQMGSSSMDITVSDIKIQILDTGAGVPVFCRSPFLGMYWIICVDGLFPSRN